MTLPVVHARAASTVMLVRDAAIDIGDRQGVAGSGSGGVEVFVLRRVSQMAFAAGMTVFPGGGVDPTDREPSIPWHGPDASWWGARWAVDVPDARAMVVAAVRELFEETGILLAGSDTDVVAGDPAVRESARLDLTAHRRGLGDVLEATGHGLRADLLRPWARWITPESEPRRYDTFFFVAALPAGQMAQAVTTEAQHGGWARPVDLLADADAGRIGLMPPTRAMVADLAAAATVDEVLASPRSLAQVAPVLHRRGEQTVAVVNGVEVGVLPTPPDAGTASAIRDGRP